MSNEIAVSGYFQLEAQENGWFIDPKYGFSFQGVPFIFQVKCKDSKTSIFVCAPEKMLAEGSEITVKIIENFHQTGQHLLTPSHPKAFLMHKCGGADEGLHNEYSLKVAFSDVHPWRHIFIDKKSAETKLYDFKIVVEGEEDTPLYVNKALLSMDSFYFRALFSGDYKECEEGFVKLSDTTVNEVLEYLYCVYPPSRPLKYERYETLWKLAHRFQNDRLKRALKDFIFDYLQSNDETLRYRLKSILKWATQVYLPDIFCTALEILDKDSPILPNLKRGHLSSEKMQSFMNLYVELL